MNVKLAQWIGLGALLVIAVLAVAHAFGLRDGWVSAGSAVVAVIVSVFAIVIPLQQDKDLKRRAHLKVLVDEVLTPLSDDLQRRHLATVSRNTFPLEWWPNTGLFVRSQGQQAPLLQPPPAPPRGLQKNRYEDARSHYPAVIHEAEDFVRDYAGFLNSLLSQAKELELELRAMQGVLPIAGTDERLGCHVGALALYVFDRLWMKNYAFPLVVREASGSVHRIWALQNTSGSADIARGTEEEMRGLSEQVERFIEIKDRDAFIRPAEQMERRLDRVLDDIARIQASEKLRGSCSALE